MPKSTKHKKTRLSLDLSDEDLKILEQSMQLGGSSSRVSTVRQALKLYNMLVSHVKEADGNKIILRTADPDDIDVHVRLLI